MRHAPIDLPGIDPFSQELSARLREALSRQGPSYEPRTHHEGPGGDPKYINRLIFETSPYLLQHAHNPVSWYPWGEEAFEAARRLDRPILLSVGYSTCHWCHVMERESFEDEEIAAFINAHYIPIKVDREERPDVDSVYMTAVQLITGGGGWPMTVVMTPDRRPFFGGTYFPARDGDRGARVGFLTILKKLAEAYREDHDKVVRSAEQLTDALQKVAQRSPPQGLPREPALARAARALAERFDPKFGGFGDAPKFPRPSTYELLLRYHRRTGDESALAMVERSVTGMMNGGIYDHVGGGFHRYSTDARWLVPHFEKMLYDNAQLVSLLVETWQATGEERYAEVAKETLDYVLREMTSEEGAFFSATDADSEGEEGKFFVWTPAEIEDVVGEERARIVGAYFGVTQAGNFEGANILHRPRPDEAVAEELGMDEGAMRREIDAAKAALYQAREARIHPILDDKVLVEWNGQMISAMARAGFALNEPRYVRGAERAATFILEHMQRDGRLLRAHRAGRSGHPAVLEDYAFFIAGLLDLFEATGEPRWLDEALRLEEVLEAHYLDEEGGGFFGTADDAEALLVRDKPIYDGAQPSGNSVAVMNLLRLHELTTDERHRSTAEAALLALSESLTRGALESPKLALALDWVLDRPKEVVVITAGSDDLATTVRQAFLPNAVRVIVPEEQVDAVAQRVPWLEGKRALSDETTAYVCYESVCKRPTSDEATLQTQLSEVEEIEAPPL